MRFWVGLTDRDWYDYLSARLPLDEVNFWQPGARRPVNLPAGAPFLFKLHARDGGWIVGGGFWERFTTLPAMIAWDVFGTVNGAETFMEMESRIKRYRPTFDVHADSIGCVVLTAPFFLPQHVWVASPPEWPRSGIQVGKSFDTSDPVGARLWDQVRIALASADGQLAIGESEARYGTPTLVAPRLGQGAFRVAVLDAYERRCAVTNERTLPVLQAAHIKPYSQLGPHALDNGILLREDLHTLFDRGYVTVTPDLELRISSRIRREFTNGRDYYALDGRQLRAPALPNPLPAREFLEWHGDVVFRA
jgi:putative restriction endonuclease